jgi:hypothetical protein
MSCVAFGFTRRDDIFKEGFVGNQVDLNLGQPKNDSQDEVEVKNGYVSDWNRKGVSE